MLRKVRRLVPSMPNAQAGLVRISNRNFGVIGGGALQPVADILVALARGSGGPSSAPAPGTLAALARSISRSMKARSRIT